jgi:DNA-binding transcriptional MocR family regulator
MGERPRLINKFSWERAIGASGLPATTRHCALRLAVFMSKDGDSAYPSFTTLAMTTGYDRSTVARHMTLLAETGWITVVHRGGSDRGGRRTSNVYEATIPPEHLTGGTPQPVADDNQGAEMTALGAHDSTTGSTGQPNQSVPDPDQPALREAQAPEVQLTPEDNARMVALAKAALQGKRASRGGAYNYLGEEGPDQRRDREDRATDTYREDMGL